MKNKIFSSKYTRAPFKKLDLNDMDKYFNFQIIPYKIVNTMESTEKKNALNKQLEKVSWGLFFIGLGLIYAVKSLSAIDIKGGVFILIGGLLLGLNGIRKLKKIAISKFTLFIGIILVLVGVSDFIGFKLPTFETIIILIGIFIVVGAISKK